MIRENQLFVFKVNHINRYKIIYLKYSSSLKKNASNEDTKDFIRYI